MTTQPNWAQAKNILCVRLDTIGDILMTTPAIRALKESQPGRRLTLLTSSAGAAAGVLVPELDEVMVYDAPWLKASAAHPNSQADLRLLGQLREHGFDAAVIFTVYSQNPLPSALLCYLADIPLRLAHCRENPYHLLTDWALEPEPDTLLRHEVRRQLDLVAVVNSYTKNQRLSLEVPLQAKTAVRNLLNELELDESRPWAVLHAGATASSRRYPPESFAEVARRLTREAGLQILFTGTAVELELVEYIRDKMAAPSHSLVNCLSLAEMAALIAFAPLLISNNSGPVHIAAATGTPVVDLYALTNPQHTPWGVPSRVLFHEVPCKYCYKSICPEGHHNCLRLVPPEAVVQAAVELLTETSDFKFRISEVGLVMPLPPAYYEIEALELIR